MSDARQPLAARDPSRLVVLLTGGVGRGKSRLLSALHRATRRGWRTGGFVALAEPATRHAGQPAERYTLADVNGRWRHRWASRRADGRGFDFDDEGRRCAEAAVAAELATLELCLVDELGPLELGGGGLSALLRRVLASRCRVVVLAVRKAVLAEAISAFALDGALVVDLDLTPPAQALRLIRRRIAATDATEVGLFAGTAGVVEVGLGSLLHGLRVPLKGHLLAYLQTLLLVTFGKALHGRCLVRISLLSAMLKAFSPMGQAIRPMLYIFLQGCAFALPVAAAGWGLPAALAGAVLMAWLTLLLSLGINYLTFGESFFAALLGLVRTVGDWFDIAEPSLLGVIAGLLALKASIAVAVALTAYVTDVRPWVARLLRVGRRVGPQVAAEPPAAGRRARRPMVAALIDLARPRFLLLFFASSLLVLFFAQLSTGDWLAVVVRGLAISYLGFLALRHLDVARLAGWLDRRFGLSIAESTPAAFAVLGAAPPPAPPSAPEVERTD